MTTVVCPFLAESKNLMDIAECPLNTESGRLDITHRISGWQWEQQNCQPLLMRLLGQYIAPYLNKRVKVGINLV